MSPTESKSYPAKNRELRLIFRYKYDIMYATLNSYSFCYKIEHVAELMKMYQELSKEADV